MNSEGCLVFGKIEQCGSNKVSWSFVFFVSMDTTIFVSGDANRRFVETALIAGGADTCSCTYVYSFAGFHGPQPSFDHRKGNAFAMLVRKIYLTGFIISNSF